MTLIQILTVVGVLKDLKGLMFQVEREANAIAQRTRRGKGNMIICSSDVASALQMAGVLDYAPALNNNLNVDDTGNTFGGVLNGKYKVYIDPYSANNTAKQYFVVGYKGTSPYDSGMFYCPYVPLQMVRAVGQDTFQPKSGLKLVMGYKHLTHLLKLVQATLLLLTVVVLQTATDTTEGYRLQT